MDTTASSGLVQYLDDLFRAHLGSKPHPQVPLHSDYEEPTPDVWERVLPPSLCTQVEELEKCEYTVLADEYGCVTLVRCCRGDGDGGLHTILEGILYSSDEAMKARALLCHAPFGVSELCVL